MKTIWQQLIGTGILIHERFPLSALALREIVDRLQVDKTLLQFIYDRLKEVHKENENIDYMLKLKGIIDAMA